MYQGRDRRWRRAEVLVADVPPDEEPAPTATARFAAPAAATFPGRRLTWTPTGGGVRRAPHPEQNASAGVDRVPHVEHWESTRFLRLRIRMGARRGVLGECEYANSVPPSIAALWKVIPRSAGKCTPPDPALHGAWIPPESAFRKMYPLHVNPVTTLGSCIEQAIPCRVADPIDNRFAIERMRSIVPARMRRP